MAVSPFAADIASLWQSTAVDAPSFPALEGDRSYDVVVVGGGYTGLSTAHYLAKKGLATVVLEASRIGWGASGRNGGVVSAKYRISLSKVAARYGLEMAQTMRRLSLESVEHLEELVAVYSLEAAQYRRSGSLHCAHNEATLDYCVREAQWLHEHLGDSSFEVLCAGQMQEETGSGDFVGGVLDRGGGLLHPLNFVRGLADGVSAAGVSIHEGAPVMGIRRMGTGVRVETPTGTVRAKQVVLATNGYSSLTPATAPVRKSVVPFRSAMLATEPLTGPQLELLRHGRSYTETRRMMRWFRMAEDRLLYGGRGAFGTDDSEAAFNALHEAMVKQFPLLARATITHRWSGLVALTIDSVPHVGRIDDRVVYAMGYNGTGVAMSSYIGKHVADVIVGRKPELGLMWADKIRRIPFYSLRVPVVRMVAGWYQFLDAIGR
ncbi:MULTISPECIES: FAD-binding oxidoreductase [Pseudomonas]|jgi:gamma-glutamylputrescine oxidase|uniref:Oxidoreductase n=1 Tax=Pseudomonas fluorescens TaxID=294 RepID=A0A0N9WR97_PSEFL|nr:MULTISPECIES: FAD-dependent oxidoreductase [Pseudomonas]ALI05237.1 oxidoreductase [Pseudomonas fluorescens]OPG72598.1 oxidoreductase [Pseudomonas ogarae]OPG81212.1 oxidoreductase [Pseudomonas ogarae]POA12948.1 FAD-binding oxidoreductase [Pseudomonas sp. MPBD7-1]QXH97032.1 FAD-binding oxidoreductase [Pseudomonas zarinae]